MIAERSRNIITCIYELRFTHVLFRVRYIANDCGKEIACGKRRKKKKEKGSRMLTRVQDNNAKAEHCNRRVTITIQQLPIVTRVASNNRGNNICGRFAFFPPGLHYSCYVSRAFLSRGLSSVLDTIDAGISETTYCSVQQKASEYVHRNTKAGLPRFAPRPLLTKPHNVRRI